MSKTKKINTRKKNTTRRKNKDKVVKYKPPSCKNIGSVINHVRLINRLTEKIRRENMKKSRQNKNNTDDDKNNTK